MVLPESSLGIAREMSTGFWSFSVTGRLLVQRRAQSLAKTEATWPQARQAGRTGSSRVAGKAHELRVLADQLLVCRTNRGPTIAEHGLRPLGFIGMSGEHLGVE
jgi:hypothetical protein